MLGPSTSPHPEYQSGLESGVDDIAIGQLLGIGSRRHSADCFFGVVFVVFAAPAFDFGARMQQRWEPMFVLISTHFQR